VDLSLDVQGDLTLAGEVVGGLVVGGTLLADRYRSTEDTYLWVSPIMGVSCPTSIGVEIKPWAIGRIEVSATSTGSKCLYVPITLPGQLYGQNVRVEEMTVHYYTSDSTSYIKSTYMGKLTSAGTTADTLVNDGTDRTSTVPTSYSLNATGNTTLSSAAGPLNVQLNLTFASTSHRIYVGGIRLRLGHD